MSVTHDELESALIEGRVGVNASDLHGSMTGYLCGGGQADARQVLEALQLESEQGPARERVEALLGQVYRECRVALEDVEMGFEPLLPEAASPLPERADALVKWCRGFLGGFGLTTGQRKAALSSDGEEILRDLGTIGTSQLACDEDEDDERSLMEVSEFVRVGAMLLYVEVAEKRSAGAGGSAKRVH